MSQQTTGGGVRWYAPCSWQYMTSNQRGAVVKTHKLVFGALVLVPALAFATPTSDRVNQTRARSDNGYYAPTSELWNCSTGDSGSLVAGAIVLGLVARRRNR